MSFDLTPDRVLSDFANFEATKRFTGVEPQPTALLLDPEEIAGYVADVYSDDIPFSRIVWAGFGGMENGDLLEPVKFSTLPGEASISGARPDTPPFELATLLAGVIEDVDMHFRQWSGLGDAEVELQPGVVVTRGIYARNALETQRHVDHKRSLRPSVTYKLHFEGDPSHTSLYYPGKYKLVRHNILISSLLVALGDPGLDMPTPKDKQTRKQEGNPMPFGEICMEPWNAVHSGPYARETNGMVRGLISIRYVLPPGTINE